jgi:CheY-like chemotaxis protein
MDWQMPGMGAEDVLRELETSNDLRDVPVIIMTAQTSLIPVEELRRHQLLAKPFDADRMLERVAEYMTGPEGQIKAAG